MAGFEFEAKLRQALSEAAQRETERGARARVVAALRAALLTTRRSFVPVAAGVFATLVALAVATLFLTRAGSQREAVPPPKLVARVQLGDSLGGTFGAFGSVWAADTSAARLLRVDPQSQRVTARVPVASDVAGASVGETLWVLKQDFPPRPGGFRGLLLRVDPGSNQVVGRLPLRTHSGEPFAGLDLAADEDSVWIVGTTASWHDTDRLGLMRIDPKTRRVTTALPLPGGWGRVGIALRRNRLWAITADSRLLGFDAHTGKRLSQTRLNLASRESEPADGRLQFAGDTLITSTAGGLAGIDPYAGQVVWRRHLGQSVLAWTDAGGVVWAAVSPRGPDRLVAVDPDDGHVATTVPLDAFGSAGIASIGDQLWITTAGGEALVLRR